METLGTFIRAFGGLTAFILLLATPAPAQTDAEVNAGIQFNFSVPGARSLAMGGAFVGLADDATAAFTNPAGLLELPVPEVSFEVRRFGFTNTFTDRGHHFGFVTGVGVDAIEGPRAGEARNSKVGLSFLSYVHPKRKSGWALGLYRHELVNFEADFRAQGAFLDIFNASGERTTTRLRPVVAAFDLGVVNFGLSAAFRLNDKLRVGFGVSFYDFEIVSLQQRFSTLGRDPITLELRPEDAPGSLFGPPDFSPQNETDFQEQVGDDEDTGFNLGLLWNIDKQEKWRLGVAFRQGPEFEYAAVSRSGAFREALFGEPRGTVLAEQKARFNVPDVFAIGVYFKPTATVKVTFDYNRIEYSALTEGLISIFEREEFLSETEQAALDGLAIDDADILRLGLERIFDVRCPVSKRKGCFVGVRFGAWHDPDHKMRFAAEPGLDVNTRAQAIQFLGGDEEVHVTAGVAFLYKERFDLNAAVDLSDTVDTVSLSAIFHFGGS